MSSLRSALVGGFIAAALSASAAIAGPTYTFTNSVGQQPSNAGVVTLSQVNATTVQLSVDLAPGYGFLNTGGPHTPFAFTISGSDAALSVSAWLTPGPSLLQPERGMIFPFVKYLDLETSGASYGNAPFGNFGSAIELNEWDGDAYGNGSVNAYYGDMVFQLTRASGLDTDSFIANANGYYFSADLTNGLFAAIIGNGTTGAQAWSLRSSTATSVPEPLTLSMFGAGLAGAYMARRRKKA